jgi:hypothetical protein
LKVKQQRREAEQKHAPSAEVKNGGAVLPLPHILHGVVLNYIMKYRDMLLKSL